MGSIVELNVQKEKAKKDSKKGNHRPDSVCQNLKRRSLRLGQTENR